MKKHYTLDRLPKWLFSGIFTVQWLWLGLRYGSATLPSALNPRIPTGGLAGESKLLYFAQIDPAFTAWVAPTVAVPPGQNVETIRKAAGLGYPLIAKPDIGWCGYGVRRVDDAAALAAYAVAFPAGETFMLQQLALEIYEAGLFYVRRPGEAAGKVIAVTQKHIPYVIGDGCSSVAALIAASGLPHMKAGLDQNALDEAILKSVPGRNEHMQLTTVASYRVGGCYQDISHHITPALSDIVDRICLSMGDFHWGRLDVRFESDAALRAGRFTLIEINGAGSEAIHFWDPAFTIWQSLRGVFAKQCLLFDLADRMRRGGHKPVTAWTLAKAYLKQQSLIARYPPSN